MIDRTHLRAVAQAVIGPAFGDAHDRYFEAIKPLVILELLDELDALYAQVGEPEERRKKIRHTPEDETCARYIFGLILNLSPTHKPPNWAQWSDDVRLMRERDKRTHEEIKALFAWANQDSFWCANIHSPSKLRAQWDKLVLQRDRAPRGRQTGGKFNFADADRSGDRAAQAGTMKRRGINVPTGDVDL